MVTTMSAAAPSDRVPMSVSAKGVQPESQGLFREVRVQLHFTDGSHAGQVHLHLRPMLWRDVSNRPTKRTPDDPPTDRQLW